MNKTTRVRIFLIITLICTAALKAQVGIGTSTPNSATIMDITSINGDKGIMITRVDIPNLNNQSPITGNVEESLLVYNTNEVTGKGFYYWAGTNWEKLVTSDDAPSSTTGNSWSLDGNSNTTPGGGTTC